MPLRQKVTGAGAALGLTLLVAGCGGSENPIRVQDVHTGPFWNGAWDGFCATPLLIWRITGNIYPLHVLHPGEHYKIGWVIGALVFLWFVSWGIGTVLDLPATVLFGATVVLLFAAVFIYGFGT